MLRCESKTQSDVQREAQALQDDVSDDTRGNVGDDMQQAIEDNLESRGDTHVG